MSELWIVIPRWEEFQHRDAGRSKVQPWIKNWTRLLSDDAYLSLTWEQRGLLHGIWLEYARARRHLCVVGVSSASRRYAGAPSLSRRLGRTVRLTQLEALRDAGFIELSASRPASNPDSNLAGEHASLEGEGDREPPSPKQTASRANRTNPRANGTNPRANPPSFPCPDCTLVLRTESERTAHRELVHTLDLPTPAYTDLD